jgi:hypothetical protein
MVFAAREITWILWQLKRDAEVDIEGHRQVTSSFGEVFFPEVIFGERSGIAGHGYLKIRHLS